MGILSNLEPKRVFEIFEEMCAIPHGSTNTKAISDWCVAFGEKLGLEHYQDEANNVILIAPATPGYEDAPAVILQGHVDMVCEKEAGCAKDMDKEGLDLFVDGDLVGAKGTTLGGDDGIAVAMALAALEDTTVQHPRLEVVLTTDEEIGMLGAAVLDVTPLQGRTMLNIDSEEEGIFTVGCAGGSSVFCHLPLVRENFSGENLEVRVSGLVGGHSGVEINKGRANADVLLGRLLRAMSAVTELRLVSAEGGSKDNAIPTAATAVITVADGGAARKAAETLAAEMKKEYRIADPGLTVAVETVETKSLPMDEVTTGKALCMLTCLPNGVQAMSMDIPGLVQTSLNIGILKCGDDEMMAVCSVRSSVASQKQMVRDRLRCLTGPCGRDRRLSRLGISAGFSPPGADDRGLPGAVRQGAGGGDRSRRSGVRIAGRKVAGTGLRVLRPGSDGHPHPQRADAHRVRPADVEAAVRGSEAQQVNRKTEATPTDSRGCFLRADVVSYLKMILKLRGDHCEKTVDLRTGTGAAGRMRTGIRAGTGGWKAAHCSDCISGV